MEQENELVSQEEKAAVKPKRFNDAMVELALFFILGFLVGVTLKNEAVKTITVGFNDYKIASSKQGFNITAMQKTLLRQAEQQQELEQSNAETKRVEEGVKESQ
jgi:hypothetical protein